MQRPQFGTIASSGSGPPRSTPWPRDALLALLFALPLIAGLPGKGFWGSHGEGRGQEPRLHVVDKRTGEEIAVVELPAPTNTAPMTYVHRGRQYIVLAVAGDGEPPQLVALALPEGTPEE